MTKVAQVEVESGAVASPAGDLVVGGDDVERYGAHVVDDA
jgi:hypothetical protein